MPLSDICLGRSEAMAQAGGIGDEGTDVFGDFFQTAIARATVGPARTRIWCASVSE